MTIECFLFGIAMFTIGGILTTLVISLLLEAGDDE